MSPLPINFNLNWVRKQKRPSLPISYLILHLQAHLVRLDVAPIHCYGCPVGGLCHSLLVVLPSVPHFLLANSFLSQLVQFYFLPDSLLPLLLLWSLFLSRVPSLAFPWEVRTHLPPHYCSSSYFFQVSPSGSKKSSDAPQTGSCAVWTFCLARTNMRAYIQDKTSSLARMKARASWYTLLF